ncbi:hypothetical protein SAMN04488563_6390 [Jiangella alkaliphila]|uniref:Septum formation initiator n=1 Tax=Jiangella alkaliphila TaxID=419479 RepID=A0A1H2LM63_9ACTN|nr:hypothetical protein SAMN04488563_6390 [Jiangella alkaliphila]
MRIGTGVLLWLAAAAAATAVGMAAVGMIGSDIFGSSQEPLTQAEVEQRLATPDPTGDPAGVPSGSPSPSPSGSETPAPTPTDPPSDEPEVEPTTPAVSAPVSIPADGAGTVIARCNADGTVTVVSAIANQGFEVDSDDDERDDHPQIKFEGDDVEVEVRLRCIDGVVTPEIEQKTDD